MPALKTSSEPNRHVQQSAPRRIHFLILAAAYTVFVVYGSLVPLNFRPIGWQETVERFHRIYLHRVGIEGRADFAANFLLFIPLSFFWLATCCMDRRRWTFVWGLLITLPFCALLAVSLEFVQLWFPPRTSSLNDVYAELTGALAGVFVWVMLGQTAITWMRGYSATMRPQGQVDWLLQAYFIGLAIYSFLPLDLTLNMGELAHKFRLGRIRPIPFVVGDQSILLYTLFCARDILTFVPVGAMVASVQRQRIPSVAIPCLGTAVVAAAIETCQIFVYSRYADTTDIVLAAVGGALGGWFMKSWRAAKSPGPDEAGRLRGIGGCVRWWSLAGVYTLALVTVFWYPFDVITDPGLVLSRLAGVTRAPLSALYWGSEFNAVNLFLAWNLYFAILGALVSLAIGSHGKNTFARRSVLLMSIGCCFFVALGIEAGQLFVASRVPDLSQVFICTFGGAMGAWAVVQIQMKFNRLEIQSPTPDSFESTVAKGPPGISLFRSPKFLAAVVLTMLVVVASAAWVLSLPDSSRSELQRSSAQSSKSVEGAPVTKPVLVHPADKRRQEEGRALAESDRMAREWIQTATGNDWSYATEKDRQAITTAIAGWMHANESVNQRRNWALRYYQRLDVLARHPDGKTARIIDWLPTLYGIMQAEDSGRPQADESGAR